MSSDIVRAARWVGVSLVLSSLILVAGLYVTFAPPKIRPVRTAELAEKANPRAFRPVRVEDLRVKVEKLQTDADGWERFWFLDQPSHMTPFRTHGGLEP